MKPRDILLPVVLFFLFTTPSLEASNLGRAEMRVVEVIAADTLRVEWEGKEYTLILLGVDSPPARWGPNLLRRARYLKMDPEKLLEMGREAKRFVEKLLKPHGRIYVEFDWIKKDPQGRLMGYVYVRDGMLNALLLEKGYARARLSFPFPMRPKKDWILSQFPFLERKAKRGKRGLWKYGKF